MLKLPVVEVGPIADWIHRRAERKALLKATDELNQSTDDMLSDIGISRDDIAYAFRSPRSGSFDMPYGRHGDEQ